MLPPELVGGRRCELFCAARGSRVLAHCWSSRPLLCRNIRSIGWLGVVLCAGTLVTVLTVIVAGLANFNPALLTLPPDAFRMDSAFASGLGAAMLIAIYDYLGYYNVCHLGDEVREPGRTIPRAVMISVVIVATIYLTMNVSIIAVVPWQEAKESKNIAALFMERLYGRGVAVAFTALILWTVVACMFAITLGYSRIPFAAARQGDFFRPFARLHPVHGYPIVSLWAMGVLTAVFCFFPLEQRDQGGRDRADRDSVHRPDRRPARAADHAARRGPAVSHVALSAPQPAGVDRLAVRAWHGGDGVSARRPGRDSLGLRGVCGVGKDEG